MQVKPLEGIAMKTNRPIYALAVLTVALGTVYPSLH